MWVLNKQNQAGDTIVEVLIALSVIGLVLAGAYATSSKSLEIVRQAQERTEASKIVENQLEVIRAVAGVASDPSTNVIWDDSLPFCVQADGTIAQYPSSPTLPTEAQDAILNIEANGGDYPSECVLRNFYHTHVTFDGANRFNVIVRWNRLGGGVDETHMVYGAYRGATL